MAVRLQILPTAADYAITEAGFGADLGAEKFLDIKCRFAGLKPSAIVLVTTVRAMKYNGGIALPDLKEENIDALVKGSENLVTHIENLHQYGVPIVVAINKFGTDTEKEIATVARICADNGAKCAVSDVFSRGGEGGIELAEKVVEACEEKSEFKLLYPDDYSIKEKIECIAKNIYGADGVNYDDAALKAIKDIESLGEEYSRYPVCIAKTQYSLSDDMKKLGRPRGFNINVREVRLSAGAGFIVVITGAIMTMPGLPRVPAAENIDVDDDGKITGLF